MAKDIFSPLSVNVFQLKDGFSFSHLSFQGKMKLLRQGVPIVVKHRVSSLAVLSCARKHSTEVFVKNAWFIWVQKEHHAAVGD